MPIKIVTDSGANMTAGNLGSCQLEVAALSLIQGDKTWLDDASFDHRRNSIKEPRTGSRRLQPAPVFQPGWTLTPGAARSMS